MVYDYPAHAKSFYMRLNDDKKTCAAFDMLCPDVKFLIFFDFFQKVGELIGGS